MGTSLYRVGVFNDVHAPWHDPKALDLVLDVFEDIGIDEIVINGDLLDFYNVNSHGPKHPDIGETLETEIYWGVEFMQNLRKRFPNQKIMFIYGNHEDRLDRFLVKQVPSCYNFFSLHKMLRLEELNIEWIPYNSAYRLLKTNFYIQHSPPSYSKNTAMVSLEQKLDISAMYGCTHRMQHAARTGASGRVYDVFSNGWLGSTTLTKEHKRIFSYAKGHSNWQQCFSIINIDGPNYYVNQIPIRQHSCFVDGHLYSIK